MALAEAVALVRAANKLAPLAVQPRTLAAIEELRAAVQETDNLDSSVKCMSNQCRIYVECMSK